MDKKSRQRLVLQMFDPDVAELQERADSFLAITTRQRIALVAQEFWDLYVAEADKDRKYEAAKLAEVDDDVLITMPRTSQKLVLDYLDRHSKTLAPLLRDDHQKLEMEQRMVIVKLQLKQNPNATGDKPYNALAKTPQDQNWKPGAKA